MSGIINLNEEYKSEGFKERTNDHYSFVIPRVEVAFVSKKGGSYSKYFMLLAI